MNELKRERVSGLDIAVGGCKRLFAAAVMSAAVHVCAGDWVIAQQPGIGAPPPPQLVDARLVTLPNGLNLYLIEDHRRPVIQIVARVSAGSLHDPEGLEGLAELHGRTLQSGGSSSISAVEIDEMLFGVDGRFSVHAKPTATVLSAQVPRTELDLGLSIVADVLMYPALPFDEIETERMRLLEAASRAGLDARVIALQSLMKQAYGPETPYGRTFSSKSVREIQRRDLVSFHSEYFRPNNTRLGIWGAFDPDEIVELVEMAFEGWEPRRAPMRRLPDVPLRLDSTVTLIHKPGARQGVVLVGHLLPPSSVPDHPALRVAASLLTHRSAGRVNRLLRRDNVGAVEVFGDYVLPMRYPGLIYAGAVVPESRSAAAAQGLKREITRLVERRPSEEEVISMRSAVVRQLRGESAPVSFRLEQLLWADEFGYPRDFLSRVISGIETATAEDVAEAARKYFHPAALHTIIVGSQSALDEAISMLGSAQTTGSVD